MWIYKSPDYVFLSTVSNAALLSVVVLFPPGVALPAETQRRGVQRIAILGGLIASAAAIGIGLWQSLVDSRENFDNQVAYAQILKDVDRLRQNGTIAQEAIVLSASHGIPWHWANPLSLRLPSFTYLDTGWNTFSPYYNEALMSHDLEPMIDAIRHGRSRVFDEQARVSGLPRSLCSGTRRQGDPIRDALPSSG